MQIRQTYIINKIHKFKEMYELNTDKRILVFSGANDFTDKLCNSIAPNAMSYHSKKTKKQKELALESFKNGSINVLCSTKALNQGFENKIGEIIILYVADSQEEKWLKSAVKNLKNIIWK